MTTLGKFMSFTETISGYFSYNHTRMAGQQDFFGQLWKEYAWSDSRYLTSDPFVLCMETVTAVRLHGSVSAIDISSCL